MTILNDSNLCHVAHRQRQLRWDQSKNIVYSFFTRFTQSLHFSIKNAESKQDPNLVYRGWVCLFVGLFSDFLFFFFFERSGIFISMACQLWYRTISMVLQVTAFFLGVRNYRSKAGEISLNDSKVNLLEANKIQVIQVNLTQKHCENKKHCEVCNHCILETKNIC